MTDCVCWCPSWPVPAICRVIHGCRLCAQPCPDGKVIKMRSHLSEMQMREFRVRQMPGQGTFRWPVEPPEEKGVGSQTRRTGGEETDHRSGEAISGRWSKSALRPKAGAHGCGRPWHCELTNLPGGWSRQGAEMRSCPHRSVVFGSTPGSGQKEERKSAWVKRPEL